ncbi:Oidioi.mRNA.OKI2018_I69.chr1.g2418.t1.cds [Oikopleura dioica]|uniref:Oidioi.mRNA.OKI2018_I69.chr1.g2418.t1.cds n=1 Tax=Oikopleura dioica TaxID=34765 RepID=A0ABN7SR01_OIKDI|nr:Oidioi.mRNA.OKI2018_I69.chr1.g2418.t1.cds [Oikopleura dioica]
MSHRICKSNVYSEETEAKAKFRAERATPTDVLNVNEDPSPSEGPVQKRPAKKIVEEGHISSKDNDIFGIRERTTGEKTTIHEHDLMDVTQANNPSTS